MKVDTMENKNEFILLTGRNGKTMMIRVDDIVIANEYATYNESGDVSGNYTNIKLRSGETITVLDKAKDIYDKIQPAPQEEKKVENDFDFMTAVKLLNKDRSLVIRRRCWINNIKLGFVINENDVDEEDVAMCYMNGYKSCFRLSDVLANDWYAV